FRRCHAAGEDYRQALNAWFARPWHVPCAETLSAMLRSYGATICREAEQIEARQRREIVWGYAAKITGVGVALAFRSYLSAGIMFGTALLHEVGRRVAAGQKRTTVPVFGRAPRAERFALENATY